MDPTSTLDQKLPLLNKLMIQMLRAGYSLKDREIVIQRILAKFNNDLLSQKMEGRKMYRTKKDRKQDVKASKAT